MLVFGGKQFSVVSVALSMQPYEDKEVLSRLFDPVVCDDWLHSAVWVDDDVVALLTAHNVVQVGSCFLFSCFLLLTCYISLLG